MNTIVLLPLSKSMVQRSADKHDHRRGYFTVHVVNHGVIKSISNPTMVIHPMIKFDVDKPLNGFPEELKWTLAIC